MSAETKRARLEKSAPPPPLRTIPIRDLRAVTLRAFGPDHPLSKILARQPDEIPADEFNARIADWMILLEA